MTPFTQRYMLHRRIVSARGCQEHTRIPLFAEGYCSSSCNASQQSNQSDVSIMYIVMSQLATACLCLTGVDSRGDQWPVVTGGLHRPGNPARIDAARAHHSGSKPSHPRHGSRWGHMPRLRGQWRWPDEGLKNRWVPLQLDVSRPSTTGIPWLFFSEVWTAARFLCKENGVEC